MKDLRNMIDIMSETKPEFIQPTYTDYALLTYWRWFINLSKRLVINKFLSDDYITLAALDAVDILIHCKNSYPDRIDTFTNNLNDYWDWLEAECDDKEYYEVLSNIKKFTIYMDSEIDKINERM